MVDYNITASQLTRNEISSLADIFETIYQFYLDNPTVYSVKHYLLDIHTIVGLGFTAVLMSKSRTFIPLYQERIETFIRLCDFQTPEAKGSVPLLCLAIAEMIDATGYASCEMNQLPYVDFYCIALKRTLSHVGIALAGKELEAEKFLKKLIRRPI